MLVNAHAHEALDSVSGLQSIQPFLPFGAELLTGTLGLLEICSFLEADTARELHQVKRGEEY